MRMFPTTMFITDLLQYVSGEKLHRVIFRVAGVYRRFYLYLL